MNPNATCGRCKFWADRSDLSPGIGECHRQPPAVLLVPTVNPLNPREAGMQFQSVFPPTTGNQAWCGAFEPSIANA